MNFLNLGAGELMTLAAAVSAVVIALYLLDRRKRKQVVATLRFWSAGQLPEEQKRRRKINQPWSLLLQLLSMLLLVLAIAGPRFSGSNASRDHVLILDTSAWMGARARQGTLLDQSKTAALAYVNALPAADRVMLVRADALATPVTRFEVDRKTVIEGITSSQPATSALSLEQAFEFADNVHRLQSATAGETVFVGAGRVPKLEADSIRIPNRLRMFQIPSLGENAGLRKLGARRSLASNANRQNGWDAFVSVGNDGAQPRRVALELELAGSPVGAKVMTLAPGAEIETVFAIAAKSGGKLEARIRAANGRPDAFPGDDHASVEIVPDKPARVTVYSNQPDVLKNLLTANSGLDATFLTPAQFDAARDTDLIILDRFTPPTRTRQPTLWIEPPAGSPFTIAATRSNIKLDRWRQDSPLATGLYTKDLTLQSVQVFRPAQGDQIVAEAGGGPIILARPGPVKMAALGFHPLNSNMKYDLATPLLLANLLRWLMPDLFQNNDVQAGTVGTVAAAVESGTDPESIQVLDENQRPLPFSVQGNRLMFFSGSPSVVRVRTGIHETSYSLSLPNVSGVAWKPPAGVLTGIPRSGATSTGQPLLWPWLALAGALGFLIDWLMFGESRIRRLGTQGAAAASAFNSKTPWNKARQAS